MSTLVIPTDYAWSTWTLSGLVNYATYITLGELLDQSQTNYATNKSGSLPTYPGQTFIPDCTGIVSKISVYIRSTTYGSWPYYIYVYPAPTSVKYVDNSTNAKLSEVNNISYNSTGEYTFTFNTTPLSVTAGNRYAFWVYQDAVEFYGSTTDLYADGQAYLNIYDTASSASPVVDMYFKIYIISSTGTATSPGYDATSGYIWRSLNWVGTNPGILVEARTATTSAGLSSATYFTVYKEALFAEAKQLRFIQIRATLTNPAILESITGTYGLYTDFHQTDTAGLNYSGKGARPTWDHEFLGRLYQCAICGGTYRRNEMTKQRGGLVCKETCKDDEKSKSSDIQIRSK